MEVLNYINYLFSQIRAVNWSWNPVVVAQEPYWKLVSKGMTNSSTSVILIVLLLLLTVLLVLIVWARISKKNTMSQVDKVSWENFNNFMQEKKLKEYNVKFLKEIIKECGIKKPERLYKEVPFLEYKVDEYLKKKFNYNNITAVLQPNSNVAKLNFEFTESIKDVKEAFDFFYKGQSVADVSSRQIKISNKAFIRIDKQAKSIETKVRDNTMVYFSLDSNRNTMNEVSAGEFIDVFYERDGQYRMRVEVLDVNEYEIKLLHSIELKRTQKRNFVRYEQKLGMRFKFASRETIAVSKDVYAGNIVDISGGGIKFNTREKLYNEDRFVAFGMWDDIELKFKAKVLRVNEIETADGTVYVGFCIFIGMDRQFVDKIVRKIFSEISKNLNKKEV